jgi:hypothetical protein
LWWKFYVLQQVSLPLKTYAGSIPDGVIGIFHLPNPSIRTVVMGSSQPLTEMNTRNISWGVKTADA